MMIHRTLAAISLTAVLAGPSLASDVYPVKVNTTTGLWISYSCGKQIAPSWIVRVPPKHGTVEIRKITIDPKAAISCRNNGTPPTAGRGLFYTPKPGFKGIDSITVGWLGGQYDAAGEQMRSLTLEVK